MIHLEQGPRNFSFPEPSDELASPTSSIEVEIDPDHDEIDDDWSIGPFSKGQSPDDSMSGRTTPDRFTRNSDGELSDSSPGLLKGRLTPDSERQPSPGVRFVDGPDDEDAEYTEINPKRE